MVSRFSAAGILVFMIASQSLASSPDIGVVGRDVLSWFADECGLRAEPAKPEATPSPRKPVATAFERYAAAAIGKDTALEKGTRETPVSAWFQIRSLLRVVANQPESVPEPAFGSLVFLMMGGAAILIHARMRSR